MVIVWNGGNVEEAVYSAVEGFGVRIREGREVLRDGFIQC